MAAPVVPPPSPAPRQEFRARAQDFWKSNDLTSAAARQQADAVLRLYDAIPSPNCLDYLWLRLCTHKALKYARSQRERFVT